MDSTQIENPVQAILAERRTARQRGLYSCCSANEYVLRAAMRRAVRCGGPVLIEATANQVNQYGGYTGMRPAQFRAFLERLADEERLPRALLLCGGDHLGPLTWAALPAEEAMVRADGLVRAYAAAGYIKIHLDTSMRLGGDNPDARLPDAVIAARGARLCRAAEEAYRERLRTQPDAVPPVYVIGSEVPVPGGATENEDAVAVTSPEDCLATLDAFRAAFERAGLAAAWERVVALVVQPGVEFADQSVIEYDSAAAARLTRCLGRMNGMVFEGHSTDYQSPKRLQSMVRDGIAILKVGPALTFGLREGLFALEAIENELAPLHRYTPSGLRAAIERAMREKPAQWRNYYHGNDREAAFARMYSFSDRVRYYLPEPDIRDAVGRLLKNLGGLEIPWPLLSQYLPMQYAAVRAGNLDNRAESLLVDRIGNWIDDYLYATTGGMDG